MKEEFEFTFTGEPMTTPEFTQYLEFMGYFSPPNMTRDQVRMLMAVLMKKYLSDVEDVEELDHLALDAVETAIQGEMQTQLDMAVGPQDMPDQTERRPRASVSPDHAWEPVEDTQVEAVAAALWKDQTIGSGTPQSVIERRTPEAFAGEAPETRGRWLKSARAAIAAMDRKTQTDQS